MAEIKLSIIVLSYNTAELLKQCLNSLKFEIRNSKLETEIIIVDNGSTDGSVDYVKSITGITGTTSTTGITSRQIVGTHRDAPDSTTGLPAGPLRSEASKAGTTGIKLIENKENLGFARGNNIGLKEARGKYILFLNSDTEVFPGSLKEAVEYMENHLEVGALTAKTMLLNKRMDPDCHRGFPTPWASITYFLGLEKLFPKSRIFGQYHKNYENMEENHEVDAGAGAFMMIPKKVIDEVGAWDENYFFYGEDLDFYYRIKNAGYKIMFYAKPLLKHHKGASSGLRKESREIASNSKDNKIKVAKASIKAMEIFYKKFYKDIYPWWLTSIVLGAIKIKGFFRIIKYQIK